MNGSSEKHFISKYDERWLKWMAWGKRIGCHQKPERSFFVKSYQLPVCASCTGVLIASFAACIVFFFYSIPLQWCAVMSIVMFVDWMLQRIGIRESTNPRRLITGLLGGYGFMTLQLYIYRLAVEYISKFI